MMFTLALVPIFGMMGSVTDIGYMHFIKESAQTAAEAAAQAAIIDFHAKCGRFDLHLRIGRRGMRRWSEWLLHPEHHHSRQLSGARMQCTPKKRGFNGTNQ